MKRLTFLIALAIFPAIALAEQHWLKATSENFELYTTAGERKAREAMLYFEQVNAFFQKAIHATKSTKGRVRVVAFSSAREYKPYQLYEGRTAYAGGGRDRDEIVMQSISSESYPIAVHEYVHILLKPNKHVPLWLNEGLAQLYQTLRPVGKGVAVGDEVPGAVPLLTQNKWLDLETLCAVDHESPYYTNDQSKESVFNSESWLLAHMLSLGEKYRDRFPQFLLLTLLGRPPAETFQKGFGKQMPEVLSDLHRYSKETFKQPTYNVTLAKSAEDPEIKPVAPFESGLVLANVLADINKQDEAKQAYTKLAAENPTSSEVPEALGYLAWRREQLDEVRAQFAKAAELGSKNARMYYDYAGLAAQASEPAKLQIELLRKVVGLDPEYRDARIRLGYMLMAESDYAGAMAEFTSVKKVESNQAFQLFHAIAYAAYRTGDKETALLNAKRAAGYAREPADKSAVEQLQAAIEDRQVERSETVAAPRQFPEADEEESGPPPAVRAHAAKEMLQPRPQLTAVEGTLDQIDCLGTIARVRMTVAGRPVRLLIDKPGAIDAKGGSFDLTCGPQKPVRKALVEYLPKEDAEHGTAGLVRVIEMK